MKIFTKSWLALSAIGFALSEILLTLMGDAEWLQQIQPKWIGLVAAAFVDSGCIVISQWFASRRRFNLATDFVAVLITWTIGALTSAIPVFSVWFVGLLYGCVFGLLLGLSQRKRVDGPWVLPCVFAGAASFVLGLVLTDLNLFPGAKGCIMGLVYGGMTLNYFFPSLSDSDVPS